LRYIYYRLKSCLIQINSLKINNCFHTLVREKLFNICNLESRVQKFFSRKRALESDQRVCGQPYNDSSSGTLCIWKSVCQPLITTTAKWVSSCCVAQDCVLDHVLRLTHTLVVQRSREQVPAISNAHWDDQLIPVGAFKSMISMCVRITYAESYNNACVGDFRAFPGHSIIVMLCN